jgi:hypothetical protein
MPQHYTLMDARGLLFFSVLLMLIGVGLLACALYQHFERHGADKDR